jgi:hypothetical protein
MRTHSIFLKKETFFHKSKKKGIFVCGDKGGMGEGENPSAVN